MTLLEPTADEVNAWLLSTIRHVYHLEYYLHQLQIVPADPERPHDIVGPGNKFEWSVIRGFALQHRPNVDFSHQVFPALIIHRQQYHHRMWNEPNPHDSRERNPAATENDMYLGAIDALCSLREPRYYQGGIHTFAEVGEIIKKNPPHKIPWLITMWKTFKEMPEPDLSCVTLDDLPNIGIHQHMHRKIQGRLMEARSNLFGPLGKYRKESPKK